MPYLGKPQKNKCYFFSGPPTQVLPPPPPSLVATIFLWEFCWDFLKVVVYHVTIVKSWNMLLRKSGPMVIGCDLHSAAGSFLYFVLCRPVTLLDLLTLKNNNKNNILTWTQSSIIMFFWFKGLIMIRKYGQLLIKSVMLKYSMNITIMY